MSVHRGSIVPPTRGRGLSALAVALVLTGCSPATTRPYYPPVTGAAQVEVELEVQGATGVLADVLKSDTLPVTTVEVRDGYIATDWFDIHTKKPVSGRALGPDVVQIRAWVDPTRSGHSKMTVETVFKPLADPSRSPRDLDQQVPPDHPMGKRVEQIVTELAKLYSGAGLADTTAR
jgi:hypothetical protein